MSAQSFRQLLEAGDVDGLRKAWLELSPNMPQPETREKAEIVMHMTRTSTQSLPLRPRAYSHRWLQERMLPSQLPDELKPSAERLYPVIAEGVGIALGFRSKWMRPAIGEVRGAMEYAVEDAYADGRREPAFVKSRMMAAKDKAMRVLFGLR